MSETAPTRSGRGRQPQDDVLVIIAESTAEDVDAAGMLRVRLDLDPQADRMVARNVEVRRRDRRDPHYVDERAFRGHAPALELAVLATLELPPAGGIDAPLVAEVAWTCPCADFPTVDRDRDVRRPVRRGDRKSVV